MKTLLLVATLCGASFAMVSLTEAAPSTFSNNKVPAWDILRHLADSKPGKKKKVPQSIRKLGFKGGGGPARVQGDCVYDAGKDISRCEDCEVDWDALVMVCKANMICWDDDKQIPCPSP